VHRAWPERRQFACAVFHTPFGRQELGGRPVAPALVRNRLHREGHARVARSEAVKVIAQGLGFGCGVDRFLAALLGRTHHVDREFYSESGSDEAYDERVEPSDRSYRTGAATKPSRWAIEGTIVETNNVGLWLRTHAIHEFRPVTMGAKSVNWRFASTELLIRWEAVIMIQAFESSGKDIGFTPADG
jgi:hypothetical protein